MSSRLKTLFIVWCALCQCLLMSGRVVAQYNAPLRLGTASSDLQRVQYDGNRGYYQGVENVDVEPPLIEHDVVSQSEGSIRQTFVATVVDDEELDRVQLFYRFAGETSYSRYTMTQLSFSSTYVAQIPTDPDSTTAIEYYLQARDTSGNRTVRGYTFSPLVREIVIPEPVGPSPSELEAGAGATPVVDAEASSGLPKIVYIIGGVLLVGLLASAAGGGGGGGGDSGMGNGGECPPEGCQVTVIVEPF